MMEELRATYDYILLDNPPYGVVVDALLCARVADRTIYVVRSGLFDKRALPVYINTDVSQLKMKLIIRG